MAIDFVRTQISTKIPKIQESLILSSVRHIHGLVEVLDPDTGNHSLNFGRLRFE
jgi:hypothetical protein